MAEVEMDREVKRSGTEPWLEQKIMGESIGNTDIEDSRNEDLPGCLFYSCFACADGYCTALNDTDFKGRPCPFFKTVSQVRKNRQDAFDRLLIGGRLDIINRYEEVLVDLGIEDPEDAGDGPLVIDDEILAARAEMEAFKRELEEEKESETDESGERLEEDEGETEDGYFD